jgi:hypothetical protein
MDRRKPDIRFGDAKRSPQRICGPERMKSIKVTRKVVRIEVRRIRQTDQSVSA